MWFFFIKNILKQPCWHIMLNQHCTNITTLSQRKNDVIMSQIFNVVSQCVPAGKISITSINFLQYHLSCPAQVIKSTSVTFYNYKTLNNNKKQCKLNMITSTFFTEPMIGNLTYLNCLISNLLREWVGIRSLC